jgi:hypothetical protein
VFEFNRRLSPSCTSNLVWQIIHQFGSFLKTDKLAIVVFANYQYGTLGVGKSRDLFQVFVPPFFFPLDILVFQSDPPFRKSISENKENSCLPASGARSLCGISYFKKNKDINHSRGGVRQYDRKGYCLTYKDKNNGGNIAQLSKKSRDQ